MVQRLWVLVLRSFSFREHFAASLLATHVSVKLQSMSNWAKQKRAVNQ